MRTRFVWGLALLLQPRCIEVTTLASSSLWSAEDGTVPRTSPESQVLVKGRLLQNSPVDFDDAISLRSAVREWASDSIGAAVKYGPIEDWGVSKVTNFDNLFCGKTTDPSYCSETMQSFNADLSLWNSAAVTSMKRMFNNAKSFAGDISKWNVAKVRDFNYAFESCVAFNADVSKWVVSNAESFGGVFYGASSFNADLSRWDVSAVTSMYQTFRLAVVFESDLSKWNVVRVKTMSYTFDGASKFNADLSSWDCSNVVTMSFLFAKAAQFNADLSKWSVGKVTNMERVFLQAPLFNSDLSRWDTKSVTNMQRMFTDATAFNSDVSKWIVSNVKNMGQTFRLLPSFNSDVSRWDVSNVQTMGGMFQISGKFNSDLSKWNTRSVTNTNAMFNKAFSFNSDLSRWMVARVTNFANMFSIAEEFDGDISTWDISNAENIINMFFRAAEFNADLSKWSVGKITSIEGMFDGAAQFNFDLSNWDTTSVTSMKNTFRYASSFQSDLSKWDVSNVEDMESLFSDASSFNSDLSLWSVGRVQSMLNMFARAGNFSSDLSSWNVSAVTMTRSMFYQASSFNSDLSLWSVGRVQSMSNMFSEAENFRSDLSSWDVSTVTTTDSMFYQASLFASDLSTWDVSAATSMINMFFGASQFNVYLCGSAWHNSEAPKTSMFTNSPGAIACNCPAGLYSMGDPDDVESGCAGKCPKGKWSAATGITSVDSCEDNLCPAGGYTTLDGLSAVGDCNDQLCTNEAYYCPAGAIAPVKVEDGYFSIPEDALTTNRTGQQACAQEDNEYCAGGVKSTTPPGYYRDGDGSSLIECPLGSYCTRGEKIECETGAGYYCPIRSFAQFQCDAGYYCPTPSERNECSEGQLCEAGSMEARACPPGTEGVNSQCGSECVDCTPGKARSAGEEADVSIKDELLCTPCNEWKYARDSGMTQCVECEEGTIAIGEQGATRCRACGSGTRSNEAHSECVDCTAGNFSRGLVSECTACEAGFIAPNDRAESCVACAGGKASNDDRTECVDCEAGRSSLVGADKCEPCPRGKYTSDSGEAACVSCLSGKKANDANGGATGCDQCESGEFQDQIGQTECKACEGGAFTGEAGSATCTRCLPGTKANRPESGATGCVPCESGEFQDQAGQTQCKECDPIAGSVLPSGSLACNPCPLGSFLNESSQQCERCQAGTYSIGGATKNCTTCDPGSSSKEGSAYCDDCRSGTFLNTTKDPPTCDACRPGFFSDNAAFECAPCGAGTWQNGTDCVACPAGYFGNRTGLYNETCDGACPPGTHSYRYATKCQDCEAGKHASDYSMEDCVACDDAKGLVPSLDAMSCVCKEGTFRLKGSECEICTDGMACTEIGLSVETLALQEGYWRQDATTSTVIKCPFQDACAGVNSTCTSGNEGVLCAVCSDGHYRPSKLGSCKDCDTNPTVAWLTLVASFFGTVFVFCAIIVLNRRMNNGILRPLVSAAQNLCIMLLFDAPYPSSVKSLFALLSVFSVGFDVLQQVCIDGFPNLTYYDSLLCLTVLTVVVLLGLCAPTITEKIREGRTWRDAVATVCGARTIKDCFVFVLLVHPVLSGKAMEFFRCRAIEGEWYLMADYSLQCYDSTWWSFLPLALFVLFGFALGTPVAIFAVLWPRRTSLFDPETKRAIPHPLDVLYRPYRPGAWFFESVNMLYKVALWCALVYFENGSIGQLLTAVSVNVTMLCVVVHVKPMGSRDALLLNTLQILICALLTSLAVGGTAMNALKVNNKLALRENDQTAIGQNDGIIRGVQVLLEFFVYALFSFSVLYALNRVYRKLPKHSVLRKIVDNTHALCCSCCPSRFRRSPNRSTSQNDDGPDGLEMQVNPLHQTGLSQPTGDAPALFGGNQTTRPPLDSANKSEPSC